MGIDVVGVDLLPLDDGYAVLELNGADDFDERHSISGRDVYDELITALALLRAPACGTSAWRPIGCGFTAEAASGIRAPPRCVDHTQRR
jgi:hypothetical protein